MRLRRTRLLARRGVWRQQAAAAAAPPSRAAAEAVTRVPIETTSDDEPEDGVTFMNARGTMEHGGDRGRPRAAHRGADRLLHDEGRQAGAGSAATSCSTGTSRRTARSRAVKLGRERPRRVADREVPARHRARRRRSTSRWAATRTSRCRSTSRRRAARRSGTRTRRCARSAASSRSSTTCPAEAAKKAEDADAAARPTTSTTCTRYVGPHGKAQSVGFASPTRRDRREVGRVRREGGAWRGGCRIRAARSRSSRYATGPR